MLTAEVELFDGAKEAVAALAAAYPLMLITKGDLLHQRSKVDQSGLGGHFRFVEVVSTQDRGDVRVDPGQALHFDRPDS